MINNCTFALWGKGVFPISVHHFLWFSSKSVLFSLLGLNKPIYTLLEQELWFLPRLPFLIMHVYVQVCDKKFNWQRDSWFAVLFFSTSDCHPIKAEYLSVSLSVSRWMINMYIQCQLCIDRDVTENVTFKLKWWHSVSNCLVRWHVLLSPSEV